MTDDYYGYSPGVNPYSGYDRYVLPGDSDHPLPDTGVTDWGPQYEHHDAQSYEHAYIPETNNASDLKVDIVKMWYMVKYDNPNKASYLAHSWWRASELLDITGRNLRRHLEALASKWEAPQAKQAFLQQVGSALYSIDEWRDKASHNHTFLSTVASQLETSKREIRRIYTEYVTRFNTETQRAKDDEGVQASEVFTIGIGGPDSWSQSDFDEWKGQKTAEARPHITSLANAYMDGYVTQGATYKGPKNAKITNVNPYAGRPPGVTNPGRPGGARPSAPQVGTRPATPTMGDRPATPPGTPPGTPPAGPILQNGVISPPTPPTTAVPTAPPTPNVGGTPPAALPPGATVPPGGRGAPPARPTTNNMGSRGAPPARPATTSPSAGRPGVPPNMQGRNAAGARPPAVPPGARSGAKPSAPPGGARPPATPPGSRAGRPGTPNAGGKPGAPGRPGAPGVPPGGRTAASGRPSNPPVIGKRAGGPGAPGGPGRPGMPGAPGGAGRPGQPPVLGQRAGKPSTPTTGKPGVPGMTSKPPQPGVPGGSGARPAQPSLGGRSGPQRKGDGGEGAGRAVRKDLGGRGTGQQGNPNLSGRADPGTARRLAKQQKTAAEPWEHDPYADEELWTVDTPGGGLIDKQSSPQQPENPGPALGR